VSARLYTRQKSNKGSMFVVKERKESTRKEIPIQLILNFFFFIQLCHPRNPYGNMTMCSNKFIQRSERVGDVLSKEVEEFMKKKTKKLSSPMFFLLYQVTHLNPHYYKPHFAPP
jgi:hypothetical protein